MTRPQKIAMMPRLARILTAREGGQRRGERPMRGLMALGVLLLVGACQASTPPTSESAEPARIAPIATSYSSAVPSQRCQPLDEVFVNMFVGLTEAALSNAGIPPEDFFAALATNRETLRSYLEALGIPADDAWIDAVMSASAGQRLPRQTLDGSPNGPSGGKSVVCE